MERLPKEALFTILVNSDYESVINQCEVNRQYRSICQSNSFWRLWLNERYEFDFEEELNYRKIADKFAVILGYLKEKNLAITKRAMKYLLLNVTEDTINNYFQDYPTNPINLGRFVSLGLILSKLFGGQAIPIIREMFANIKINYEPGENIVNGVITTVWWKNYKQMVKTIMIPTDYFDKRGKLQTIDFDEDLITYIIITTKPELNHFQNKMVDVGKALYLAYFD